MARERILHSEVERRRRSHKTRSKLPAAASNTDMGAPGSATVPEDSALFSTDNEARSSASDVDGTDYESSSVLSTSSEEPSSDSGGEEDSEEEDSDDESASEDGQEHEDVVTLAPRGSKPAIRPDRVMQEGPSLRERLKTFLPQLAEANRALDEEREAGVLGKRNLEVVDEEDGEGKEYIEMNLGLGVLEEKDPNAPDGSDDDSESDVSDEETEENIGQTAKKEKDILGKLMGRKRTAEAASIEEVEER